MAPLGRISLGCNYYCKICQFRNYQEFVCEKGIGFVRIDGNTLARDRQSAVLSFRSSNEARILFSFPAFFICGVFYLLVVCWK